MFRQFLIVTPRSLLLLLFLMSALTRTSNAQSSAFTYQGHLQDSNGVAVSGSFDLMFGLYTNATNGEAAALQTNTAVPVNNGIFTTALDFSNVFNGSCYWLEIGLRTNSSADDFTILSPRQEITAAPYALFSKTVDSGGITGVISDSQLSTNIPRLDTNVVFTGAVQFNNPSNLFTGQFAGDGGSLSNLNAANLQGTLTAANPVVHGTVSYAPDIVSISEYVTNNAPAAPIVGLVRRCLYAPYDAVHLTNWCLILRSQIRLDGEYSRAVEPTGATTDMPTEYVFGMDGNSCVVYLRGNGSYMGIEVDGADDWSRIYTPPDGNFHFYTIQFAARARRQIALKLGANYQFGGVYMSPTNGMWPGVLPKQNRMIIMGDSFTEDSPSIGWSSCLMSLFQNLDVWASAVGSTGYLNPGTSGRVNFQTRLFPDVITNSPDYVLFAGGINDNDWITNSASSNALYTACLNMYTAVETNLPNCKIVVLGPFWPRTPSTILTDSTHTVNYAISNACFAAGIAGNYIDTLSDPWVTGVYDQPGSGNATVYTSGDGTHPTEAGQWNIAYHVASELAKRFPELQLHPARR